MKFKLKRQLLRRVSEIILIQNKKTRIEKENPKLTWELLRTKIEIPNFIHAILKHLSMAVSNNKMKHIIKDNQKNKNKIKIRTLKPLKYEINTLHIKFANSARATFRFPLYN